MAATDLTPHAMSGFLAPENNCPFIYSSPAWFAWQVGAYLKRTGRNAPRSVRMGRGCQVHANDMLLTFDGRGAITRVR